MNIEIDEIQIETLLKAKKVIESILWEHEALKSNDLFNDARRLIDKHFTKCIRPNGFVMLDSIGYEVEKDDEITSTADELIKWFYDNKVFNKYESGQTYFSNMKMMKLVYERNKTLDKIDEVLDFASNLEPSNDTILKKRWQTWPSIVNVLSNPNTATVSDLNKAVWAMHKNNYGCDIEEFYSMCNDKGVDAKTINSSRDYQTKHLT